MFSAFIINGGKHLISVLEGSASGAAVETEMTLSQPHPVPFYTGCGFEWYISVMQKPLRQTTEQETLFKKNKQTKKTYLTCSNCCFKLVIEVLIWVILKDKQLVSFNYLACLKNGARSSYKPDREMSVTSNNQCLSSSVTHCKVVWVSWYIYIYTWN